jgi:hypothetical protein
MVTESDFKIIYLNSDADWNKLIPLLPQIEDWGLPLLKKGLGAYARSVLVEPNYICKDHRNLHSNFYSKKFIERPAKCARLHFFSKPDIRIAQLQLDAASFQNDYIGFSVIRPVRKRCIGRTIIDPHKVGRSPLNHTYCLRTEFHTRPFGPALTVSGYPYMSQDAEVTRCAHTALWGACRYLSERYPFYKELYPYDLVSLTSDAHGRRVPYRGMRYLDYSTILTQFGCHPEIIRVKDSADDPRRKPDKYRYLCYYVESGFPILASFEGHVVSIIGHTLDTALSPDPDNDDLISGTAFYKQLVVVDDNLFPYQLLGECDDGGNYGKVYKESPRSLDSIRVAVCPLPEKVFLPADKAEQQLRAVLGKIRSDAEMRTRLSIGSRQPLVTRIFITNSASLRKRRLQKAVSRENRLIDPLAMRLSKFHLPHFVWVMEVSPLSLYQEGKCTAEIVLDATANQHEMCLLYARVGQNLLLHEDRIEATNVAVSHQTFEQYTHNLGEF